MKTRVTLLGDSIRLGYEATVRAELADLAEIWSPEENCMHSVHHACNLRPWYLDRAADLIHVNFGLWDCRRLDADRSDNLVPEELFARNLDHILERVRAASRATVVWATITPVVQARFDARFSRPGDPCRVASDVERYNAAAAPVLARHGVAVNDLHALVEARGRERLVCEDGVHFTTEACAVLGREVARFIRPLIS